MDKPDVDSIEGLSPAISIDQKTTSRNPRSTVGTVTEIYDYLRLLWARIGHPHCHICGKPVAGQSAELVDHGRIAPSLSVSDGSGTTRSGSISICEPRPVHRGHAPCGELNEKIRGSSSGITGPWSGQANFSE